MGLGTACSAQDVAVAYRRLAKDLHPDQGGSKQEFQQLHRDYEDAKRYVERGHGIRGPVTWKPAQGSSTLRPPDVPATPVSHKLGGRALLVVTIASSIVAVLGFQLAHLPATCFASLVAIVGSITCAFVWLPKLDKGPAVISTAVAWSLATTAMLLIRNEIAMAFSTPQVLEEWALFYGVAPIGYFVLTVFGLLGLSVTLVRD